MLEHPAELTFGGAVAPGRLEMVDAQTQGLVGHGKHGFLAEEVDALLVHVLPGLHGAHEAGGKQRQAQPGAAEAPTGHGGRGRRRAGG